MGNVLTNFFNYFFGKREVIVLMVGLCYSGKTTILYKLKLEETIVASGTIGFNVETFEYRNVSFTVWDCGGGGKTTRQLFHSLCQNTHGLIFVVDSTDHLRMDEAKEWLTEFLAYDELRTTPCLIFANKQDCPDAMNTEDIVKNMDIQSIPNANNWHIQATCALTGTGLYEGLQWLASQLNN